MPFSTTRSCTEQEWTQVFEEVFKPAVENAGLGYECRRSTATRGNIVAEIIRDLNDAHVVLADLTDRNANVFYELGVRHALTDRSIIVAQDRRDIPFDLGSYASHVYDWRSTKGKEELTQKLRDILREIDSDPDRPDNPVSDFLEDVPVRSLSEKTTTLSVDTSAIPSLVGPKSEELDVVTLVRVLEKKDPNHAAKEIRRKTRPVLVRELTSIIRKLNETGKVGSIAEPDIPKVAQEYIAVAEPIMVGIEQFALTAVEVDWREGAKEALGFAGDLITMSEPTGGRSIRFATGLPGLLALRLLIIMGAKALMEEAYELADLIINDPIESERHGRFSHRPLRDRRNLFYSEAFLGYANLTAVYMNGLWERHSHIQHFFESKESFEFYVAQFLMLMSLTSAFNGDDRQFYPGYKLFPRDQALRAMSFLSSRLANRADYREKIAKIIGFKNGSELGSEWTSLASKANEAKLGSNYWDFGELQFPQKLGEPVE